MTDNDNDRRDLAQRMIESLQENEQSALDAVRDFVETVDGAFPSLGENGPRRRIIDAAFKMTQQLVDTSNKVALNIVQVTEDALEDVEKKGSEPAE